MTAPGGTLSERRPWLSVQHHVSRPLRHALHALLRRTAELLFGSRRDPARGPIFVEVDPDDAPEDTSWCEAPAVHPAEVERLLERIRDRGRADDLRQILAALQRLLPLLRGAEVPAHRLQGMELSMRQQREADRDDADGFGLDMAWLLLEREVAAVGSALE